MFVCVLHTSMLPQAATRTGVAGRVRRTEDHPWKTYSRQRVQNFLASLLDFCVMRRWKFPRQLTSRPVCFWKVSAVVHFSCLST